MVATATAAKSHQLCPTLCDPIDGSSTGSSVPGILQARVLEWVAVAYSMIATSYVQLFFNWRKIALPNCVGFCCETV